MNNNFDWVTFANIMLAGAIALFTYITAKATMKYARIYALDLFLQHLVVVGREPGGSLSSASREALGILREEFPHMYTRMSKYIDSQTRAKIQAFAATEPHK